MYKRQAPGCILIFSSSCGTRGLCRSGVYFIGTHGTEMSESFNSNPGVKGSSRNPCHENSQKLKRRRYFSIIDIEMLLSPSKTTAGPTYLVVKRT